MGFAERLKELRIKNGFSQEELAEKLGQTKANISKYENARIEPSVDTILYLTDLFEVSSDYLLGKTEIKSYELPSNLLELIKICRKLTNSQIDSMVNFLVQMTK